MATSPGKTAVLIILILLMVFMFLRVTPLFMAPLGFLAGTVRGIDIPNLGEIFDGPFRPFHFPLSLMGLFMLALWVAVIIWIYRDAENRGMNGLLWALLVFIGNLIALIVYLIIRSESNKERSTQNKMICPDCEKSIADQYAYCPYCGASVKSVCPACKTDVQKDWLVCPKCGEKLEKGEQ